MSFSQIPTKAKQREIGTHKGWRVIAANLCYNAKEHFPIHGRVAVSVVCDGNAVSHVSNETSPNVLRIRVAGLEGSSKSNI